MAERRAYLPSSPPVLVAFAVFYMTAAELGHLLSFEGPFATFWPPAGLAAAVFACTATRAWPAVAAAVVAANVASDVGLHGKAVWTSLGFCVANLAEAVSAGGVLRTAADGRMRLTVPTGVGRFVIGSCVAATGIGGAIGACVVAASYGTPFLDTWRVWWAGDAIGMLVVAPVVLELRYGLAKRGAFDARRAGASAVTIAVAALLTHVVVGRQELPIAFSVFLPLLVLAVRHDLLGVSVGLLVTIAIAAWHTTRGEGPFAAAGAIPDQAFALKLFAVSASVSFLLLGAVAFERSRERWRAEEERRETAQVLDAVPSMIWHKDLTNRILRVNRAAAEKSGKAKGEIEGRRTEDVYPTQAEAYYEVDRRVMRTGEPVTGVVEPLPTADGPPRLMSIDKLPTFDATGAVDGVIVVATDITERREAERRLAMAVESGGIGLWDWRVEGGDVYFSPEYHDHVGAPHGTMTKFGHWADRLHPDDRAAQDASVEAVLAGGGDDPDRFESSFRLRHASGEYRWVLARGQVERDAAGKAIRLFGTAVDITDTKRLVEELDLAKLRYELAVRGGTVGLWDWDVPAGTVYYSPEYHDQLGAARGTLSGLADWEARLHPEDIEQAKEAVRAYFAHEVDTYESVFRVRDEAGRYRTMLSRGRSTFDDDGEPLRFAGTHVDITETQRLIEELRQSNEALDSFAYVASHDLKAPLRAIDHLSDWLVEDLERELPEKSACHLAQLKQRVRRMESLLDDLLQYARAGRKRGEPRRIEPSRLLESVLGLLHVPPGFTVEADLDIGPFDGHATPLETVLRNVIGNALKHHDRESGRIVVSGARTETGLAFEVADDGPGVPEAYRERVFEIFRTLKPRDEVEGSGMGLALVRKLVGAEGGSVSIHANTPRGAIVRWDWPLAPADGSLRELTGSGHVGDAG